MNYKDPKFLAVARRLALTHMDDNIKLSEDYQAYMWVCGTMDALNVEGFEVIPKPKVETPKD